MIDSVVFWLNDAIRGAPALALAAALLWGVASVLLSPCHLGTIPLVVGFVSADRHPGKGRGAALAFAFAGGMLLAILLVGLLAAALGHALSGLGQVGNYLIAAIFIAAALNLLDLLPLPDQGLRLGQGRGQGRHKGLLAALGVGLLLGIGLSPCTFAFLAPVLGATAASAGHSPLMSFGLLLAFGVGHCGVVGIAGSSTALVQRYLDWSEGSRGPQVAKWLCAVLLLLAASTLIYLA